jgi:hypothetical protein
VDGTTSGSCPVAGFGISGVEPSGSATSVGFLVRWLLTLLTSAFDFSLKSTMESCSAETSLHLR